MKILTKYAVGSVFVSAGFLFFSICKGIEIDLVDIFMYGSIYYGVVVLVAAIFYAFSDNAKEEYHQLKKLQEDPEELEFLEEDDEGFEIKDIITKESKVIGTFDDGDIYDVVDVLFKNGLSVKYKYFNVIHEANVSDVSYDLPAGSLILKNVVYIPQN